ncbi:glutathione S-transferase family protein [Rhizobium halophytocola]|uniref:glutathione transferase n=1 Tax=Rhizobium halophytocola TaxID=735519 RepID=A0ABS4DX51_9HYPH|nr:glutathione S-transferase family protein [Rhizobium halophytocola]MBP1850271.1 glutathione S-transferase [Rhizobium halophytocola]
MIERPKVFGADYSVYVRIVRLCLIEKGIDYDLLPVDVFAETGPPSDYLPRHPFGRIPAFEHDGFLLFETSAIARYIDEGFPGPPLQPSNARQRARCNQMISIADHYAYPHLVWGLYVERLSKPARGTPANEEAISSMLPKARTCLAAMSDIMGDAAWLAGDTITLADLYAAPMFDYALMTAEGRALIERHHNLSAWWTRVKARPSMAATTPTSR